MITRICKDFFCFLLSLLLFGPLGVATASECTVPACPPPSPPLTISTNTPVAVVIPVPVERSEAVKDQINMKNIVKGTEWWAGMVLQGYDATGLITKDGCRLRGSELLGEPEFRFRKTQLFNKNWTLEGDIGVVWGDFRYIHQRHRAVYIDLKELKLRWADPLLRLPFKTNLVLGRQYVAEDSGLWYRNYLDAVRVNYLAEDRGAYLMAATRFEDSRVSNSQESVDLSGHSYLIGRVFWKGWRHELFLEGMYEHVNPRNRYESRRFYEEIAPQRRLWWVNLGGSKRLTHLAFWLRGSVNWGSTERVYLRGRERCSGDRRAKRYQKINIFGGMVEGGAKWMDEMKGIGIRGAWASGHGHDFYLQPRIANNREKLFGFSSLHFLGDLSHPKLQNIWLVSVFGGLRLPLPYFTEGWLEALGVRSWRVNDSMSVAMSRYIAPAAYTQLEALGTEADLIVEGRRKGAKKDVTCSLVGSYFWPDNVFPDLRPAYEIYFRITFMFKHRP